jgi:hypothetical protein
MELTEHKARELYHFCNETADALRPILNMQNPNPSESYWISTLQNFIKVIESILQPGLNIDFVKVDETFIKDAHLRIFSNTLNSMLPDHFSNLNPKETINTTVILSNQIAKLALKELYGVTL